MHTLLMVVLIVDVGDCADDSLSELWMILPKSVRFGTGGGASVVCTIVVAAVWIFFPSLVDCLCNDDDEDDEDEDVVVVVAVVVPVAVDVDVVVDVDVAADV